MFTKENRGPTWSGAKNIEFLTPGPGSLVVLWAKRSTRSSWKNGGKGRQKKPKSQNSGGKNRKRLGIEGASKEKTKRAGFKSRLRGVKISRNTLKRSKGQEEKKKRGESV